jgi:small subunit ribosomal protein S2
VIALVDTNCDPDEAQYVIPGNDDAIRSCTVIVKAIADGIEAGKKQVTERELAPAPVAAEAPAADIAEADEADAVEAEETASQEATQEASPGESA